MKASLSTTKSNKIVVYDYFRRYPSTDGVKDGRTSDFVYENFNKGTQHRGATALSEEQKHSAQPKFPLYSFDMRRIIPIEFHATEVYFSLERTTPQYELRGVSKEERDDVM
jgi:hypothetical protein